MKYSESVTNLSKTTPHSIHDLFIAESMLQNRNMDCSQRTLDNWCAVAADNNIKLLELISWIPADTRTPGSL